MEAPRGGQPEPVDESQRPDAAESVPTTETVQVPTGTIVTWRGGGIEFMDGPNGGILMRHIKPFGRRSGNTS